MEVKSLGEQGQQQDQTQQGQGQQQQTQGAGEAQGGASEAAKTARPDWLPESYFDAEKGAIKFDDFGKHYGELATAAKTEQERIAAYPKTIDELKFELPAEVKLPEGMTLDDKNPTFQAFKQFAFENKMDPKVGSQLLGMYVQEQVAGVTAVNNRVAEEQKKLGANAPARISALRTFFDAQVGPDLSKSVMAGVFTADQVQAMEKIMLAMSDGGTKGAPGTAREPGKQEISDEDYEAMSPRERLEYARSKQGANRS